MFWGLTLDLLARLMERHRDAERRADRRAGEIAAQVLNTMRSKRTDKLWQWTDLFPEHLPPKKAQTEEEMLEAMRMWATVFKPEKGRA